MAHQRWGERSDNRRRRSRRLARLALLGSLLTGACGGGSPFDPGTVPSTGNNPGTYGGGGGLLPGAGNADFDSSRLLLDGIEFVRIA